MITCRLPAQEGHLAHSFIYTAVSYWVPLPYWAASGQQELAFHLHMLSASYSTQPRPDVNEGWTNTGQRVK